jgi:negative regulator of flagellin synthesis FlgM
MTTDIKGLSGTQVPVSGNKQQVTTINKQSGNVGDSEKKGSTSSDTIDLTAAGKQLQQLEQQLMAQPIVDTNKVEAAKQAIANGEYKVDGNRIGNKLMQFEALIPAA